MTSGRAYGHNRRYQVACRDVLVFRSRDLRPWRGDGIDVLFELDDTRWTIDVALRSPEGHLVVAECRRTVGPTKQEAVAAFAYKVERLREALRLPVAGVFFTKAAHQLGAVRVGQFAGIQLVILGEAEVPPGFSIAFLRYDPERERKCRDIVVHVPTAKVTVSGRPVRLRVGVAAPRARRP
jgi:hypothetical protein